MSTLFVNKMFVGNTWDFSVCAPDYSAADGWALRLYLVPRFTSPVQATVELESVAAADGSSHRFQLSAAQTAAYKAGQYGFQTNAVRGSEVYTLDGTFWSGEVTLSPNPATLAQGADTRTEEVIALAAIRAVLANRATVAQKKYTIADRSLELMPLSELLQLEARFQNLVNAQRGRSKKTFLRWGRV